MKKLLVILLILISGISNSQPYVLIPDPAFQAVLDSAAPGCIVGSDLNTSHPGLAGISFLDFEGMGVSDITGVEYLPNLMSINGRFNQISFLPPLPPNVSGLYIGNNQFSSFPLLPFTVTGLKIDHNPIGSISSIPSQISSLDVSGCGLSSLPALPAGLGLFFCSDNNLTSLPSLPANLQGLLCQNNQLASIPQLPNGLYQLAASGNGLVCIPNLPTNPAFTSDIGYIICGSQGTPDSWYPRSALPALNGLELANCFNIGTKCYLGGGSPTAYSNLFWEFNSSSNSWTQKANIPVQGRLQPVAFSVGNKGYLGMGQGAFPVANNDIWEYNPATNLWSQKASYPGNGYMGMSSFVIGDKAYVGLGFATGSSYPTTFYKFDPKANSWTSIATFPGAGRRDAACFTIGNKGYVCAGDGANSLLATSYSFNPTTDSWSSIASTPDNLNEAASFSINGKGYIACGQYTLWTGPRRNYLIQYDPLTNVWTSKANMPTLGRQRTTGCTINGRGYVGTGLIEVSGGGATRTNDWWEYTPTCYTPSNQIFASSGNGGCTGDSIMLFADQGNGYQWKRNGSILSGATLNYFYATISGNYTCAINNTCGSVNSIALNIIINAPPVATISASGPTTFCAGGNVTLNANTGVGLTYQWKKYGNNIASANSPSYVATGAGVYKVTVTNAGGCSANSSNVTVIVNALPTAAITAAGSTAICPGSSVTLNANTGTGLTYQWRKFSNDIVGATSSSYLATGAGQYKVRVTNVNGCSKNSNSITVTTLPAPTASITANGPTTFCAGDSVKLTANSGSGLSYQWKKGSNNIAGATLLNYSAKNTGNYKVTVTGSNGCVKNSNVIAVSVPCRVGDIGGVKEVATTILVYPNPSSGIFNIELPEAYKKPFRISVTDLLGKSLIEETLEKNLFTVDLTTFPEGIYLVKIQDGNKSDFLKLFKYN